MISASFPPQDGDVLRGLGVGPGGEEPQEAVLAGDRAVFPHLPDADVVHARAAVDGRFGVRLADDEHRAGKRPLAHPAGELADGDRLRVGRRLLLLEHAQPRPGVEGDRFLSSRFERPEGVGAIPEEDEAPVAQPAQERLDLAELVPAAGHVAHAEAQLRNHVADLVDHEAEIVGGLHHVLQAPRRLGPQRLAHGRVGYLRHLRVDHRLGAGGLSGGQQIGDPAFVVPFHGHERVREVHDLQVLRGEELADGVHDEGPFGDVGPDDRDRRRPAAPVPDRIGDLHVDAVRTAAVQEVERVDAHPAQVLGRPFLEQFRRRLAQEEGDELLQEAVAVVPGRAAQGPEHFAGDC